MSPRQLSRHIVSRLA